MEIWKTYLLQIESSIFCFANALGCRILSRIDFVFFLILLKKVQSQTKSAKKTGFCVNQPCFLHVFTRAGILLEFPMEWKIKEMEKNESKIASNNEHVPKRLLNLHLIFVRDKTCAQTEIERQINHV